MADSLDSVLHSLLKSALLQALQEGLPPPPKPTPAPIAKTVDPLQLLSLAEVTELLHVSARTVHSLTQSGDLPCLRIGSSVRYRRSSLQEWIEAKEAGRPAKGRGRPAVSATSTSRRKVTKRGVDASLAPEERSRMQRLPDSRVGPSATQPPRAKTPTSPHRLQQLAVSLGVAYEALPRVTNGDLMRLAEVDMPTLHGWQYRQLDMPEPAMAKLENWVLSFRNAEASDFR